MINEAAVFFCSFHFIVETLNTGRFKDCKMRHLTAFESQGLTAFREPLVPRYIEMLTCTTIDMRLLHAESIQKSSPEGEDYSLILRGRQ